MRRTKAFAKKGFSMIELIIVIAVLGVLTAVVLNQAQGMRESSNLNRESSNLGMLSTAIQSTFNSQGTFQGLQNNVITRSTSFPNSMVSPGGDTQIKTAWDDAGVTVAPASYNGQANAAFTMTYDPVPQTACVDFVSQNFGSFFRVDIDGVRIHNTDPSDVHSYSIAQVISNCNASGNSEVTFYSR